MAIKIEKNIPMPTALGKGVKSELTVAAETCEIGDSFLVDSTNANTARSRFQTALKTGRRFTIKKCGDKFRAWRIK